MEYAKGEECIVLHQRWRHKAVTCDCVIQQISSHNLEISLFTKQYFKNETQRRVNSLTAFIE